MSPKPTVAKRLSAARRLEQARQEASAAQKLWLALHSDKYAAEYRRLAALLNGK